MKANRLEQFDAEWIDLIIAALDLGLTVQDIQYFLRNYLTETV